MSANFQNYVDDWTTKFGSEIDVASTSYAHWDCLHLTSENKRFYEANVSVSNVDLRRLVNYFLKENVSSKVARNSKLPILSLATFVMTKSIEIIS